MAKFSENNQATIDKDGENRYIFRGVWLTSHLQNISYLLERTEWPTDQDLVFDFKLVHKIDTNSAYLISELVQELADDKRTIKLEGMNQHVAAVFNLVKEYLPEKLNRTRKQTRGYIKALVHLGEWTVAKYKEGLALLAFVGEICSRCFPILPIRFRNVKQTIVQIEQCGLMALPIIGLLSFLVGVVLAYQMGVQLERYGGNIYLVDFTAFAILREFAPLITAIIFAGRTGAAFTSQLANMKLSEEIAALEVMGISAFERLILPRIFASIIVLPLLSVWADLTGLVGAMVMGQHLFDISCWTYVDRLSEAIKFRVYFLGLIKTPVFAFIVSIVGCYQGLSVGSSSVEVGQKTTASVVQSIFLIIVADALFSIVFSWQAL